MELLGPGYCHGEFEGFCPCAPRGRSEGSGRGTGEMDYTSVIEVHKTAEAVPILHLEQRSRKMPVCVGQDESAL